jgi:transcriptional regulator with XRE-family HTH domain
MNMIKKDKGLKDKTRLIALELLAIDPGMSQKNLASKLGVQRQTIAAWCSDPLFIDAWYKRFMEVAGSELPNVVSAMIREAKEGNVQAGRLILEHFGKLDTRVKIQVESPFEKFMKMEVEDAQFVEDKEISSGAISIGEQASSIIGDDNDLPPRNSSNDSPRSREEDEKSSLKYATQKAKKDAVTKYVQKMMYQRRKRAKDVGLKLLPRGRSSKSKRNAWWDKLERLEVEKYGKIQGERYED